MCSNNLHIHHHHGPSIYIQAQQYDPTHTTTLRNEFSGKMGRRFRTLRGVINKAIVERDVFGLEEGITTQQEMNAPQRGAFNFPRRADKVAEFMRWLERQEERGLLETSNIRQVGQGVEGAWTNRYINDSYKRGVQRARMELRNAGYSIPSIESAGGIEAVMSTPFHVDRVGLLYTRAFNELKGITEAMNQQISRILSQGLVDGDHPRLLARKLNSVITGNSQGELGITDQLGRRIPPERRARLLARTEIIRAHAEATLQEYRNWGVEGVDVVAEFRTAGDNRVCPICAGLQGRTFKISEAEGLIPVHPQCRCTWIPARRGEDV